jgi:hypothetical protein
MNLRSPPEIEKLIDDYIRSGKYDSAEHVVMAAIMTLNQQDELSEGDLKIVYPDIEQKFAEGLAASEAGDVFDGDVFFDQLDREEEEELAKSRKTA